MWSYHLPCVEALVQVPKGQGQVCLSDYTETQTQVPCLCGKHSKTDLFLSPQFCLLFSLRLTCVFYSNYFISSASSHSPDFILIISASIFFCTRERECNMSSALDFCMYLCMFPHLCYHFPFICVLVLSFLLPYLDMTPPP